MKNSELANLRLMIAEQAERRERWEAALPGGEYRAVTVVSARNEERAHELARIMADSHEAKLALGGLGRAVKAVRERIGIDPNPRRSAQELLGIAHQEFRGNAVLADIEIESGLLEPFTGTELAECLAGDIIRSTYIVEPPRA